MSFENIMISIITSLIASIVFFLVFEFVPHRIKRHKIRPRIEVELMEVSNKLFFYIEQALRHSEHSPSFFQEEIREDRISQSDFEIGLQNKCLNNSYLYDDNADKMMIIGDQLAQQTNQIEKSIQRVLINQDFLTAEEILLLEDVIKLLHTYSYAMRVSDGVYPLDPTISYMAHNFFELYKLYRELRTRLYAFKEIRQEKRQGKDCFYRLQWERIIYLIGKKDYEKAEKGISYLIKRYNSPSDRIELKSLLLRINVERNRIDLAKKNLEDLLYQPNRLHLVYQRSSLQCIRNNNELMAFCESCCSDEELKNWNTTVLSERKAKEDYLAQNKELRAYYKKKTEASVAKAKNS